jgi:hypothetical protein
MAKEMLDPVGAASLTRFAQLASRVLDVPLVHISLVDAHHRCVESSQETGAPDAGFITDLKMPLLTWDGRPVGTLSLKDRRPRRWSAPQIEFLKELCVRIVGKVDIGSPHQVM